MIAVWFLVIYWHDAMVTIPQASREACIQQQQWINSHRYDATTPDSALCVAGVKP